MVTSSVNDDSRNMTGSCSRSLEHAIVVVGVPAYNEAKYLRAALESLRRQSMTNFLAVIADNASTDGTDDICRHFAATDLRFVNVRHEHNIGAAANFQFLRDHTRSEFFCTHDSHKGSA